MSAITNQVMIEIAGTHSDDGENSSLSGSVDSGGRTISRINCCRLDFLLVIVFTTVGVVGIGTTLTTITLWVPTNHAEAAAKLGIFITSLCMVVFTVLGVFIGIPMMYNRNAETRNEIN